MKSNQEHDKGSRIPAIDVARGLSMLWIVAVWHLIGYVGWFSGRLGNYMLSRMSMITCFALGTFMFLSAFCLGKQQVVRSFKGFRSFYTKRLMRILPLFFLSLVTFPNSQYPKNMMAGKLFSLMGLSSFIPETLSKRVPTVWFASMIISFYMLFPWFMAIKTKRVRILALCTTEALFVFGWVQLGWDVRLWQLFPSFAMGLILSSYNWTEIKTALVPMSIFAFVALLIADNHTFAYPILAIGGTSLVLLVATYLSQFKRMEKKFAWLAYVSLSAYLFHRHVYGFFCSTLDLSGCRTIRALEIIFGCVPLIFLVAYAIQRTHDATAKWLTREKPRTPKQD